LQYLVFISHSKKFSLLRLHVILQLLKQQPHFIDWWMF